MTPRFARASRSSTGQHRAVTSQGKKRGSIEHDQILESIFPLPIAQEPLYQPLLARTAKGADWIRRQRNYSRRVTFNDPLQSSVRAIFNFFRTSDGTETCPRLVILVRIGVN